MCSAIFRRTPRNGMRVSPSVRRRRAAPRARASPAWARTSSEVTRPAGPVPVTSRMSTSTSRASLRVAGVASTPASRAFTPLLRGARSPGAADGDDGRRRAAAGGAAAPAQAASATSIAIRTFPTGQIWPSANISLATRPARGVGISTVALSVMISTIGWSSCRTSPSLTSQRTTSPSATPSPMSGRRNSYSIRSSPRARPRRGRDRRQAGTRARACTGTACRIR